MSAYKQQAIEVINRLHEEPTVPIRCAACPMMNIIGRARYTGNNDHLSQPRGSCYCRHPEAEAAFRLICPGSGSASCFIAFARGGTNEPDIKTAPRWCPRMLACKPREIDKKDAAVIIEHRHPYGLFFLKDGGSYVGIDNSDGNAWTEEFFTKRKCLEWLTGEAREI